MKRITERLKNNFKRKQDAKNYQLIQSSSFFDHNWYLNANPDVLASGMDPVFHYLQHGVLEGREPGPLFDSAYYLSQIPSLPTKKQTCTNPLLHFIQIGRRAGLKPYPEVNQTPNPVESKVPNKTKKERYDEKHVSPAYLPELKPIRKLKLTALVITWDVGHNPLGRSYMLAEALEHSIQNVILCGFQFSRYGTDIWEPVRNGALPVISLAGGDIAEWLESCEKAIKKFTPDIVIACKPRLPSIELGLLFKQKYGIPLIIDVDDHELAFTKSASSLSIENLYNLPEMQVQSELEPHGELWTRVTDSLTRNYADGIITSNSALHREFGGTVIPHVRDEKTFNPELYDKCSQRQVFNIPTNAKVVMFFGTPRVHKGIGDIAAAVGTIKESEVILVIVGDSTDKRVTAKIDELAEGKVFYLPNQPFSKIPEIIVMADLIVLPQDLNHPISKYQLPAKAIDAIGMGVPLIVSGTEPLLELVKNGVAKLLSAEPLHQIINREINNKVTPTKKIELRQEFLKSYSYHSAALKLKSLIEKTMTQPKKPLNGFSQFVEFQKNSFCTKQNTLVNSEKEGVDIVIFWKQNDTGLYGRRHDMVIKYLSSREDVRKIVLFDAPISEYDIQRLKNSNELTQGRNIYIKVYEKLLGKLDSSKVSYNVFTHPAGIYSSNSNDNDTRISIFDDYSKYLKRTFERENVNPKEAVFWFYPKITLAENIIDFFNPNKVVVDVVDDHRSWPNVSEVEKEILTEHYRCLLREADMCFANCQPVIDSMKVFNPEIELIANGCEDNPLIIEPTHLKMYRELKSFRGKVIGFVGNLEAKIDIGLLEKIAKTFSNELIVLVGSTHANPKARDLEKYDNIRLFGVVPYKYINAIVSEFDVGIVPHKKMALTDNMNPLKVFVYLSNKIPVLATEVKNLPSHSAVKVVASHDRFIEQLQQNFENPVDNDFSFLSEYTWESRLATPVDRLLNGR